MNYEVELKKCLLEKDIFSLKAAQMEQKKLILDAQKRMEESKVRLEEYDIQVQQKLEALAQLGG